MDVSFSIHVVVQLDLFFWALLSLFTLLLHHNEAFFSPEVQLIAEYLPFLQMFPCECISREQGWSDL